MGRNNPYFPSQKCSWQAALNCCLHRRRAAFSHLQPPLFFTFSVCPSLLSMSSAQNSNSFIYLALHTVSLTHKEGKTPFSYQEWEDCVSPGRTHPDPDCSSILFLRQLRAVSLIYPQLVPKATSCSKPSTSVIFPSETPPRGVLSGM